MSPTDRAAWRGCAAPRLIQVNRAIDTATHHGGPAARTADVDDRHTRARQPPFDARGIARRFRHSAIFGALDALQPGEAMRFVNDHDPLPLLDQLRLRYGERLAIAYRARGPGPVVIDFLIVA